MKINAAFSAGTVGTNSSVAGLSATETVRLLRKMLSGTPRVRTESASHAVETTAHRRNPRRTQPLIPSFVGSVPAATFLMLRCSLITA
jgi:hypothetical protein